MLSQSIGWCGKLPIQADFIQSNRFSNIEKNIMDWIIKGQNHLGEKLVKMNDSYIVNFYYFSNKNFSEEGKFVRGVLFNSRDQRGRICPFVMFCVDEKAPLKEIFLIFFQKLNDFKFKFSLLNSLLIDDQIFTNLMEAVPTLDLNGRILEPMDYWVELYPTFSGLELKVEKTNHIVYRKLMLK
ncbi:TagF domain-containing protein [Acinetobacter populi]|uniref:Type VI secretion-associated protein n=1 Tax=Acinetobacter populi TaxID=1582270 RepID=A0A1Z9Z1D9_9GAMM|nr:TagF domain-containing protein [Acinetobacter populi]OUY08259.1 hypothetical protein CAP51_01155 [Acinetobacter populi]